MCRKVNYLTTVVHLCYTNNSPTDEVKHMKDNITIEVDDSKTQRLLRKILHQLEDIYETIDSIDDISDITMRLKSTTQKIQGIAPNSEEN